MRNTRKSGQILRSKKRPHPTLRSGRGSRTNSNTSYQIQARVIEADGASAVQVPRRSRKLCPSSGQEIDETAIKIKGPCIARRGLVETLRRFPSDTLGGPTPR